MKSSIRAIERGLMRRQCLASPSLLSAQDMHIDALPLSSAGGRVQPLRGRGAPRPAAPRGALRRAHCAARPAGARGGSRPCRRACASAAGPSRRR
jgi:hypothetical protein